MSLVEIHPHDEVHVRVKTDPDAAHEIRDSLTFEVPGAKFTPRYKMGAWDGKVSLFSPYEPFLYKGLVGHVVETCEKNGHVVKVARGTVTCRTDATDGELVSAARAYTPRGYDVRDYQVNSFVDCVKMGRAVVLSSTSSGKTLMIYRVGRWYAELTGLPTLVLTTRTNLVAQMRDDFIEYSGGSVPVATIEDSSKRYPAGSRLVVSTWQSALRAKPEWFSGFGCVVADEAHSWDSSAFIKIASRWNTNPYRFGFSGTLDGTKVNRMTLVGVFGEVTVASTNSERIAAGDVSKPKITVIRAVHSREDAKLCSTGGKTVLGKKKPLDYAGEVGLAVRNAGRMKMVVDLCSTLRGNTLVLFHLNEDYGYPLRDAILSALPDKSKFAFVNGKVPTDERRAAQRLMEENRDGVVVLASLGTFSEGMSVDNIKNVVFAYPMKSRVRVLQSIGRGIRKDVGKEFCRFYDVVDDFRNGRRENLLWRHGLERCAIYEAEGLDYRWVEVDLSSAGTHKE